MVPAFIVSTYRSSAEELRPMIGERKQLYQEVADPTFETYGPTTDFEYKALMIERGALPA